MPCARAPGSRSTPRSGSSLVVHVWMSSFGARTARTAAGSRTSMTSANRERFEPQGIPARRGQQQLLALGTASHEGDRHDPRDREGARPGRAPELEAIADPLVEQRDRRRGERDLIGRSRSSTIEDGLLDRSPVIVDDDRLEPDVVDRRDDHFDGRQRGDRRRREQPGAIASGQRRVVVGRDLHVVDDARQRGVLVQEAAGGGHHRGGDDADDRDDHDRHPCERLQPAGAGSTPDRGPEPDGQRGPAQEREPEVAAGAHRDARAGRRSGDERRDRAQPERAGEPAEDERDPSRRRATGRRRRCRRARSARAPPASMPTRSPRAPRRARRRVRGGAPPTGGPAG